jgi:hypothetical protein
MIYYVLGYLLMTAIITIVSMDWDGRNWGADITSSLMIGVMWPITIPIRLLSRLFA